MRSIRRPAALLAAAASMLCSRARADDLPSPLPLPDLLRAVRRRNPSLAERRGMARAGAARPRAAAWPDDPMLMLEWWQQPTDFSTVPLMLTLKQPIPWAGKLRLRREVGERDARVLADDADEAERRAVGDARRAYFDLALAERDIAISRRIRAIDEQLVGITDAQYRVGKVVQADLLRAQSELMEIDNALLDLERAREDAITRLNGLLDRPAQAPLGPTATAPEIAVLPSEDELRARALARRPDVRRAHDALAAAESRLALARRENLPEVALWSSYMVNINGVDTFTVGASTTLPVFSTPRKRALAAAAQAEVEAARASLQAAERQTDVDVRQALLGLDVAARHVRLHAEKLIPLAELTLQSTLAAYQTGRVDFTTVLQAARMVRDHHLDHQKYFAEYERRRADLEQAIGGDLDEAGGAR